MAKELQNVKGVGPTAQKKLEKAGVRKIADLAELDLRTHDVDGLSKENLAKLRDNARRFLQAQKDGNLTLVEGLGPSAQRKLKKAGVKSIEDLVVLDLRSDSVEGLSTENIQKLKRNAQYLL